MALLHLFVDGLEMKNRCRHMEIGQKFQFQPKQSNNFIHIQCTATPNKRILHIQSFITTNSVTPTRASFQATNFFLTIYTISFNFYHPRTSPKCNSLQQYTIS